MKLNQCYNFSLKSFFCLPKKLKKELSKNKEEQNISRYNEGQKIDAKISSVDLTNRKFALSIRQLEIDEEQSLLEKYGSKSSIVNFISLGLKKGYFCLVQCDKDKRKKYLFPRTEFTKIWCQFISRSEGAPIDESVNWNEVCSKPCDC